MPIMLRPTVLLALCAQLASGTEAATPAPTTTATTTATTATTTTTTTSVTTTTTITTTTITTTTTTTTTVTPTIAAAKEDDFALFFPILAIVCVIVLSVIYIVNKFCGRKNKANETEMTRYNTDYTPEFDQIVAEAPDESTKETAFYKVFCSNCCVGISFLSILTLVVISVNMGMANGEWYLLGEFEDKEASAKACAYAALIYVFFIVCCYCKTKTYDTTSERIKSEKAAAAEAKSKLYAPNYGANEML